MKFHISRFYNALQGAKYALQYGIWYAANENYFRQFLDLKQEELFFEYSDQFSRLQDACGMEDDDGHDLISFLRGMRPDIMERMNDYRMGRHETGIFMRHIGKQFRVNACLSGLLWEKLHLKTESHHN